MHFMFIGLDFSESNCVWAVCLPLHVPGDAGGNGDPVIQLRALSEPVVILHIN